ncbi:MAG TPA: hypothetical protein VLB29_10385 [Nocardioidaceae bacterium]|nr:hypothetical protein [Nocardioidaceae bacterium]
MPRAKEVSHADLVHALVATEYDAVESSVEIVREKRSGKDAAVAVSFDQRNGAQRRGLIGLCRHHDGLWQPSGAFMGSVRGTGPEDVFMTSGGWGPGGRKERAVLGGWVADPAAVSARLVDMRNGDVLVDEVLNGVVVFMCKGDLALPNMRVELLDSAHRVLRAGPVMRRGH